MILSTTSFPSTIATVASECIHQKNTATNLARNILVIFQTSYTRQTRLTNPLLNPHIHLHWILLHRVSGLIDRSCPLSWMTSSPPRTQKQPNHARSTFMPQVCRRHIGSIIIRPEGKGVFSDWAYGCFHSFFSNN